jgi:Uma2 family endonuclease
LHELIKVLAEELGTPLKWCGSTRWDDAEAARGLEPDECYLLTAEKVAEYARTRPTKAKDCPRPDLAVEVDISRPQVDRAAIYATLGIPEVWRFDGKALAIDRLRDDGTYESAAASRFLPIPPAEVVRWVATEESADDSAWSRRLRAWVRAELAPPRP